MSTFGDVYANSLYSSSINSQGIVVGDAAPADPSAALDVHGTSKGMLFPRLTTLQMNAILSPANGLTIYNTDESEIYYYNGSTWIPISGNGFATLVVGGGVLDPSAVLQVNSTTGGFALPRMTQMQRDAIPSPIKGLEVYVDDPASGNNNSVSYYNGSTWVSGVRAFENNILLGRYAGGDLTFPAGNNVFIGDLAGQSVTIGGANTVIGYNTIMHPFDSFNTYVGCDSGGTGGNNKTSIGFQAISDKDNQVMLGNSAITEVVPNASAVVNLGTSTNPWNAVSTKEVVFPSDGTITLPVSSSAGVIKATGAEFITFDSLNKFTGFNVPTTASRSDKIPTHLTATATAYQLASTSNSSIIVAIPALMSNIVKLPDPASLNAINADGWQVSIYNSNVSTSDLVVQNFAGDALCVIEASSTNTFTLIDVAFGTWTISEKNGVRNVVTVAKAGGDFTTITDALVYLATLPRDPTNCYVIRIAPGLYLEPPITMIQYVGIIGDGNDNTIISPIGPAAFLMKGCVNSYVQGVSIVGGGVAVTAVGVYMNNNITAGSTPSQFLISNCVIVNCATLVEVNDGSPGYVSNLSVVESILAGPFTEAALANSTTDTVFLTLLNVIMNSVAGTETSMIRCTGPHTSANIGVLSCQGIGVERGLYVEKGATVVMFSSLFNNCNASLYIPDTDALIPNISLSQFVSTNAAVDVNIQNPLSIGFITGSFTRAKTIMLSDTIAIEFQDPTESGQVRVGQLISGDHYSVITNVSQLYSAAPTMGLMTGGSISQAVVDTLFLAVSKGFGYIQSADYDTSGDGVRLERLLWDDTFIALPSNKTVYVYFATHNTLTCSESLPNPTSTIMLGRCSTLAAFSQIQINLDFTAMGNVTSALASKYLVIFPPGINGYFLWLNVDGTSLAPTVYGLQPLEVAVLTGDTPEQVVIKIETEINTNFSTVFNASQIGDIVTVINVDSGSAYKPVNPYPPFTYFQNVAGSATTTETNTITVLAPDVSGSIGGTWFYLYSPLQSLTGITGTYIWFNITDLPYTCRDPHPEADYASIKVDIASNSTISVIAIALANAINASGLFLATYTAPNVVAVAALTIGAVYSAAHSHGIPGVVTSNLSTGVGYFEFIEPSRINAKHNANSLETYIREVMGIKFVGGCSVTPLAPSRFTVSHGVFYYAETRYTPADSPSPAVFAQYYKTLTYWDRIP